MNLLEPAFFLALVAVTTLISYAAARLVWAAPARSIGQAFRALIDWAGMFTIFFGSNAVLGAAVILLVRGVTPHFLSIYTLESVLLVIFSAAQAFVFQMWWRR
jgi:hypothetical protein